VQGGADAFVPAADTQRLLQHSTPVNNRGLPMPKGTDETGEFGRVGRRFVEIAFDGVDIVSDGVFGLPRSAGGACEAKAS
jgi:hypothetical protein